MGNTNLTGIPPGHAIHHCVQRSYTHSNLTIIKSSHVTEVVALLLLCGHEKGGRWALLGAGDWWIVDPVSGNKSLYRDGRREWVLSRIGLIALGITVGE